MTNEITTTDFAEFGSRERKMAEDILRAWRETGLPEDFYEHEVTIMMNKNSGNMFLTNSDFQVAMERDGKLYSFYTTPYNGLEGAIEELLNENKPDNLNQEDINYLLEIAEPMALNCQRHG